MLLWITLLGIGCAVVIAQAARYQHDRTLERWSGLLSPSTRSSVRRLELQIRADAAMADDGLQAAQQARDNRDYLEAIRLLELSCSAVAAATPDRLKRLRAMAVLIRMATALVPIQSLRIRDYRLREMIALVGLGAALHHILISALERFLLRVRILGIGFRLTLRVLIGATNRVGATPARPSPWNDYARALEDWKMLDREHLETFRALVLSLETGE
jgi:hypothetical protein